MHFLQRLLYYVNGRYGMDEFSKVLMIAGLLFLALSNFVGGRVSSTLGVAVFAFAALRPMSKQRDNRLKEYRWYMRVKQRMLTKYHKIKNRYVQRKVYKFYKCPECKQKIRVPKGKKKIRITCPSCQHSFIKKT